NHIFSAYRIANLTITAINSLASASYGSLYPSSFDPSFLRQLYSFLDLEALNTRALNQSQIERVQQRVLSSAFRYLRRLESYQVQRADENASLLAELLQSSFLSSSATPQYV